VPLRRRGGARERRRRELRVRVADLRHALEARLRAAARARRDALRAAASLGLPVVALGGVTPERASALYAAGAAGVAAIRAWLAAPDPAAAVRALGAGRA
jgi:thiamine monophosphate synthase